MDKNIAALLREDAVTVMVVFPQTANDRRNGIEPTPYKYVTHLELTEGDTVIVEANGMLKLVEVREVHSQVEIRPNEDLEYKWVYQKVDMSCALANQERNNQIVQKVADAYKANLRRSFAQQILSGVDDAQRESLTLLLKGN